MKSLSDLANAVGMCCTVLPDGCVEIDRFAFAAIVEGVREEVREECAKIAQRHFIYGHSVAGPGFAAECAEKIRALNLK